MKTETVAPTFHPGKYAVEFHAIGLSSGVCLYRLEAGNFVETKKLVVLR